MARSMESRVRITIRTDTVPLQGISTRCKLFQDTYLDFYISFEIF